MEELVHQVDDFPVALELLLMREYVRSLQLHLITSWIAAKVARVRDKESFSNCSSGMDPLEIIMSRVGEPLSGMV